MRYSVIAKKKIIVAGIALAVCIGAVGCDVFSRGTIEEPEAIVAGVTSTPEPLPSPALTSVVTIPPESILSPIPLPTPTPYLSNIIADTSNFTADGVQLTVVN